MLTTKQLSERKLGIGGSDMPIILGLSIYKTPYQLYLEKIADGDPVQSPETTYQYWGNQLEPVIREHFAKKYQIAVETPDTIVHREYTFLRANVDGFIPSLNAVLEIKTASGWITKEWGENGSDVIPLAYRAQVAHYCLTSGAEKAIIAVLIGGNDYREYIYTPNDNVTKIILNSAKTFWDCVTNRTPPAPSNTVDCRLKFGAVAPEKSIQLSPKSKLESIVNTLAKLKEEMRVSLAKEDRLKTEIMQDMGDAEYITDIHGKPVVSWKMTKRGRMFLMGRG